MKTSVFLLLRQRGSLLIQITTAAYLDPALLRVGDVIGDAFVAGTYPDYNGNAVSESNIDYFVDGVEVASTYTLLTGDIFAYARVTLSATGAADRLYDTDTVEIIDFTFTPTDLEWEVPEGDASSLPDAFVDANWSVSDLGTNGDISIVITGLPADGGSALTDIEYRVDGGSAVSLVSATTGTYNRSGFTDGVPVNIELRALNGVGAGPWGNIEAVTPTGVPSAFVAGNWTLSDLGTGGDLRIAISALPGNGGSALTDLDYRVDGGSAVSLGGTTTGNYDISGFTDDVEVDIELRAENANGSGAWGDLKSATPTTSSGIAERGYVMGQSTNNSITLDLTNLTPPGGGAPVAAQVNDVVLVYGGRAASVNDDVSMVTIGYTEIEERYSNDVNDANSGLFIKAMLVTADTSAEIVINGVAQNGGCAMARVFSGVDTVTPQDVAVQGASGTNGGVADAPAITPVNAGAWIVAFYFTANGTTTSAMTGPANMTDFITIVNTGGTSRRGQIGSALKKDWTSGAFDPDAIAGVTSSTDNSWVANTIVLRAA